MADAGPSTAGLGVGVAERAEDAPARGLAAATGRLVGPRVGVAEVLDVEVTDGTGAGELRRVAGDDDAATGLPECQVITAFGSPVMAQLSTTTASPPAAR